jgi:flagellar basal body rod protein FlgB
VINGFINRVSSVSQLKDALDVQSQRVRSIADRVSKASMQNQDGFALPNPGASMPAPGTAPDVDIESEMTNLADAQLRFEATSKLLSTAYAQIRTAIQDK